MTLFRVIGIGLVMLGLMAPTFHAHHPLDDGGHHPCCSFIQTMVGASAGVVVSVQPVWIQRIIQSVYEWVPSFVMGGELTRAPPLIAIVDTLA